MYFYFHDNMLTILVSERPCRAVVHAYEKSALGAERDRYVDGANPLLNVVPMFNARHCDNILREPRKTDVMNKAQVCTVKRFKVILRVSVALFSTVFL